MSMLKKIKKKLTQQTTQTFNVQGYKQQLDELFETPIDPEDRTTKNVIKMMLEDGLTMAIPGGRDGYINFLQPFLRIIKKEKSYFKNIIK